jgi:microcystin degradation protein MlrC
MTAFYDARAEQAVNDTAAEAVEMFNQLLREDGRPEIILAEICFWSAQKVAPDAGLARQLEMARLAKGQVLDVIERLRFAVAA